MILTGQYRVNKVHGVDFGSEASEGMRLHRMQHVVLGLELISQLHLATCPEVSARVMRRAGVVVYQECHFRCVFVYS
jgi:hypothetical protein